MVRTGTLTGAVAQIGVGIATVSRRIERLETALGRPIFARHQTGYRLTEDGAAMIERAEEMEAVALAFASGTRHEILVEGTVRLATAENLATDLILPALGYFKAAYPQLSLEIVTDISTVNLHQRDADIALRMVKPDRGNVSMQKLGTLGYGLYGSAEYMSARGSAKDTGTFATTELVGWSEAYAHLPAARWIDRVLEGNSPALTTTSLVTQLAACTNGLGLAVLPHFIARPRQLVCLEGDLGIDQPIWLVTHSDLAQSRRVQAVADFLRELVKKHRTFLS